MKILFFNKALRILLWTNALILMAGAMFGPIYAIFVEEIGGDLMDASIAWGVFAPFGRPSLRQAMGRMGEHVLFRDDRRGGCGRIYSHKIRI